MFVPVTPTQASPRAKELAGEITDAVRKYKADYPNLTHTDLQQAFRVAQNDLRAELRGSAVIAPVLVALGLALALLAGLLAFFLARR